jgi:imidazolonepropionase-like amidohydrolase
MLATLTLAATLFIRNATIVDGEPRRGDVVIEGETITCAGSCTAPKNATVIDATGKYVLPGFVDMHAHLLERGRDDKGEFMNRYNRDGAVRALALLLAHGVTTIRDPGSETETIVTIRRMLAERKLIGPRLFTAGRILIGSNFDPEPFSPVRSAEDIRREIRWQADAGVDFIKLYSSITPAQAKIAIDEAHARGLPVIGHLQRTTWTEAAQLGIDAIAHGSPWAPEYLPEAARADYQQTMLGRVYWLEHIDLASPVFRELTDALTKHRVSIDPTLIAYHTKFFGNDPRWLENRDNALVAPKSVEWWRKYSFTKDWTDEQYAAAQKAWPKQLAFIRLLFDRGVLLTVGTDTPTPWIVPGASFHSELELLVDAGIPPRDVLRMATRNAGVALKKPLIGAIQRGAVADVLILGRNPLEDIRNTRSIEVVIARGVRYDPAALLKPISSSSATVFGPSPSFTSTQSREKVETTRMSMPAPLSTEAIFAMKPTQ